MKIYGTAFNYTFESDKKLRNVIFAENTIVCGRREDVNKAIGGIQTVSGEGRGDIFYIPERGFQHISPKDKQIVKL